MSIKLSLVKWSFRTMTARLCELAREVGIDAIEMVDEQKWQVIRENGMNIPVADGVDMGMWAGFSEADIHERLQRRYIEIIPKLKHNGIDKLVCYSGKNTHVDTNSALEITARGLEPVVREAEKHDVTIVLELLSSRVTDTLFCNQRFAHYWADNPEWGAALCEKIASENFKLLYDVWHMEDMKRDVPADIEKYSKYIAHYHIAGLGERRAGLAQRDMQFYQKVFLEIKKSGYSGYVGLEYARLIENIPEILASSVEFVKNVVR